MRNFLLAALVALAAGCGGGGDGAGLDGGVGGGGGAGGEGGGPSPGGTCGGDMHLTLDMTGTNVCTGCTNQDAECPGGLCAQVGNAGVGGFCAARCEQAPCGEGQACMAAFDPDRLDETGACAPIFGCTSPSAAFPCADRVALDDGRDVAFLVPADGEHAAVLRDVRDTTGVECAGESFPDPNVGTMAVLTTRTPGSAVTASNVEWTSVRFSDDGAWLVYIDGVDDLCLGAGNLRVARSDGAEPRLVASGQRPDTFFVVGDYVAFWTSDGRGGCRIDAAPLAGGDAVNVVTSVTCYPGRNIFDNAIPDPAGSAFLFSDGQVIRNPDQAPYFTQTGAVQLARLARGSLDTLDAQPDDGLNGYPSYVTWSPDGESVALAGGGHVTVAEVGGARDDLRADCTCSAVTFSPRSTLVAWDAPANAGMTVASRAVVQPLDGSAATSYDGLPGSGLQGLAFTADDGHLLAVRADLLLVAKLGGAPTFSRLADDVHRSVSLAPSGDFVAVLAPSGDRIDVYPIDGGAPKVAAANGGDADVDLGDYFRYSPASTRPRLAVSGSAGATGVHFVALAETDGTPSLLAGNVGAKVAEPLWPVPAVWHERVLLFPVTAVFDGAEVGSWDVAGVADDGSLGGTLARAVTAAFPAGGRLFYLRQDEPGLWVVPIAQPAG
jgi:hypothetical protein